MKSRRPGRTVRYLQLKPLAPVLPGERVLPFRIPHIAYSSPAGRTAVYLPVRIDREGGLAEFQHGGGDCFREALAIAGRAAGWNRIWYRSGSVLTRIFE